jgi:hypothetical protein
MLFDSIALIQYTDKHTEVLGGLISLVGNTCKKLHIYYVPYPSDFVRYYIDQHIVCTPIYTHKNIDEKMNHDLYIFVTGMEYNGQTDPSKTLLLSHHTSEKNELQKLGTLGVFSISPVYHKVPYFLSFYKSKSILTSMCKSNQSLTLLFVGYTNPENKDLKGLIRLLNHVQSENLPIKLNVVNYYPIEELDNYQRICKVYVDMSARKMMKLISDADYVLTLVKKNSSYHRNQLSGIIPLAVSIGTPLIIDRDLAEIYGLSESNSLIYDFSGPNTIKNTVLNIFEQGNSKSKDQRSKSLIRYRDKMINVYQKKMKKFLKKIIHFQ